MRKSIILFAMLFLYILFANIYGCASSEDEKYPLLTSKDKKLVNTLCKCVEPIQPYLEKMMNTKDSLTAIMYADSLEKKTAELEPCFEGVDELEAKERNDEKYTKQFLQYIEDKHPKCLPFFLGVKSDPKDIK
jgi:hypothetical protein